MVSTGTGGAVVGDAVVPSASKAAVNGDSKGGRMCDALGHADYKSHTNGFRPDLPQAEHPPHRFDHLHFVIHDSLLEWHHFVHAVMSSNAVLPRTQMKQHDVCQ